MKTVTVPAEPTEEMIERGMEASVLGRPSVDDESYVLSIYRAMLAAAPQTDQRGPDMDLAQARTHADAEPVLAQADPRPTPAPSDLTRLRAENESLRKDAERYRRMRGDDPDFDAQFDIQYPGAARALLGAVGEG